MTDRSDDLAPTIDVFALARAHGEMHGRIELARFPRLAPMLASSAGSVDWRLTGAVDARGHPAATLALSATLVVKCDRCGLAVDLPGDSESAFWFVATEEELNAQPIEVDAPEPLLGSRHFAIAQLVEDELILSIPISPRHAHCALADDAEPQAEGPRPLAALAALKSRH